MGKIAVPDSGFSGVETERLPWNINKRVKK
jgi:hypothetical protein